MFNRIMKIDNHKHSTFELEQLLKHKPIQIANRLLQMFGEEAEQVVRKYLPESLRKEEFMVVLRKYKKEKENRNWNRGTHICV